MTSLGRALHALPVLSILLALPGPAAAQAKRPFGEGTHALRVILHRMDLEPIATGREFRQGVNTDPERILIICLGKTDFLTRVPGGLPAFIGQGGALLLATDRQCEVLRDQWGVGVTGELLSVSAGSKQAYRGSPDCPFVVPYRGAKPPIFDGLTRVATNAPSYLKFEPGPRNNQRTRTLARVADTIPDRWGIERVRPFAVAGDESVDGGRLLLFADHSLFINDMMLQTDNDNFDLARAAISWLTDGGKRNRVLLLDDGDIVTSFDVPMQDVPPLPLPSEADLVRFANKAIVGLEREDFFNQMIRKLIPRVVLWRGVLVVLTLAVAAYFLLRLVRSRYRIDARVPLLQPALAALTPPAAIVDLRHQAMHADGNYWDAAREMARRFFDATPGGDGPERPRVRASGDWRQRFRRWRQVHRLWRLAHGRRPWRVSARALQRLANELDMLKAALADGSLAFQGTTQPILASGGRQPPVDFLRRTTGD